MVDWLTKWRFYDGKRGMVFVVGVMGFVLCLWGMFAGNTWAGNGAAGNTWEGNAWAEDGSAGNTWDGNAWTGDGSANTVWVSDVWMFGDRTLQEVSGACDRPAREILEQMEDLMRGESSYSEMTMRIVRPRYTREMSMKAWQKGGDSSMILVTAPARDRGTAFLMHEKDIWNYDPRIDRTTRLPSSMMSQSWMGSDFTNDDLVRESDILEDYTYTVEGEDMLSGELACRIEMIPKPDAPVVWGKVLLWISAEGGYQLRVENYDQRGELAFIMELDDIRELGGRTIPTRFTMRPAGIEGEFTEMTYRELQFNVDLDDSFFRRSNMERLQ